MPSAVRVVERIQDQADFVGPLTPLYYMRLDAAGTAFEMAAAAASYTDEAAQDATATLIAAGIHTGITFSYNDVTNALSATNTDRGSTAVIAHEAAGDPHPQYLTAAEGNAAYASIGITQYTNEDAQDATAAMIAAGTHTGITFAYNDAANSLSATVTAWLGAATSVVGRAFGTSGGVSDIVATADGQVLTRVAGVLAFAAPAGGGGDVYLANANTFTGSPQSIVIGTAANKGLIVRGAASQTANLQEWQNSGGTVEGYFKSGDGFYVGNTYTIGSTGVFTLQAGSGCQVQMNAAFFQLRDVAGNNTGLTLYPSTAAQCVYVLPSAGTKGIIIQGAASQTATLVQLQGISSVQAREMADIDAQWVTSTDASRKAKLVLRVWDTAVREPVVIAATGAGATVSLNGSVVDESGYFAPLTPTFVLGIGTPVAVGTNLTNYVIVPRAGKIVKAFAAAKTGPTGADLIVDINKGGTSIWASTPANRLKIVAGATSGTQTAFDTVAVAEGDLLSIDIDQVGSSVAGQDVTVSLLILGRNI